MKHLFDPTLRNVDFVFNTKSTLKYPFEFCCDISFIGKLFSRNWNLLFVFTLLISDLTFVFLLLSLPVSSSIRYFEDLFSYHELKQLFTKMCY